MAYAKLVKTKLLKTTDEAKLYTFNFSADMEEDETISGVPVIAITPASGAPTAGTPVASTQSAQVLLSAGSVGTYYVSCLVTTSSGETLECIGTLVISEM